ncbi:MAG: DUF87 domain-containing protein [Proteobacteria bacterium]|nr:MAG: DUF87 domain-containing protein [Pseudomonadota bacterium]
MKGISLSKTLLQTNWLEAGLVVNDKGEFFRALEGLPLSSGLFEEGLDGPNSNHFYQKLSELLTRLPSEIEAQIIMLRTSATSEIAGFYTKLLFFERVKKKEAYSHLGSLLKELGLEIELLQQKTWQEYLSVAFGPKLLANAVPDIIWQRDHIVADGEVVRAMSLTELPQVTWNSCFQDLFEQPISFAMSFKLRIPDRHKLKRQLETKRRVSHALSISSSLEVKNIESNSVLSSSEETLERILVNKETLYELSVALFLRGSEKKTRDLVHELERNISGVGNAGLYGESIGTLPVLVAHLPGQKMLGIRKLPILTENLAHVLPLLHDFSRSNDPSSLQLRSRSGEVNHLNLFSKENLNFNSFICGASGAGKSFLMNAMLASLLEDEASTRICIFDIGGSYRKLVTQEKGETVALTSERARNLIATYLRITVVNDKGFFRTLIESLCGSGSHISHSHLVAIEELLKDLDGEYLQIASFIRLAGKRKEPFYQDLAHWLKPHIQLDSLRPKESLDLIFRSRVTAFDFKELESDPVLQRTTLLLLSEMLWSDLTKGTYSRTLIIFDEVWRFFERSKQFLEEMYRTLRKYRAGIASITQNLADYGDEAFAKMIFTNSYTKIFLQNGAAAEFLRETFDLPESDIQRALSVVSRKPHYSEFFALSPSMSQVFRLLPTAKFYELANTENVAFTKESV